MDDVMTVLQKAEGQLAMIRTLYEADLELQRVSPTLRGKINGFLENERAALDHLAQRIVAAAGSAETHVHYPLAAEADRFEASMDKNMPGVATSRPELAAAISHNQPHNVSGLADLRHLLLDEKHQRLTARTEPAPPEAEPPPDPAPVPAAPAPRPPPSGGTGSGLTGPMFINGVEYDPVTLQPLNPPPKARRESIYVDWQFEGDESSALQRLEDIHQAVRTTIDRLSALL